jgi:hypothetical protein
MSSASGTYSCCALQNCSKCYVGSSLGALTIWRIACVRFAVGYSGMPGQRGGAVRTSPLIWSGVSLRWSRSSSNVPLEGRLTTRTRQADEGPAQRVHIAIGNLRPFQQRHPHQLTDVRHVERGTGGTREDESHPGRAGAVFAQDGRETWVSQTASGGKCRPMR